GGRLGRQLAHAQAAARLAEDDVGEGAAAVDAELAGHAGIVVWRHEEPLASDAEPAPRPQESQRPSALGSLNTARSSRRTAVSDWPQTQPVSRASRSSRSRSP